MKLINERGRRAHPQFGINGLVLCGATLPERALTKSRKEMQAGVIPAAIGSYNCIICARADRSYDDKFASMLPRNDGN